MANFNPWMKSFVLTNANTNYNLLTLMQSVDANAPKHVSHIEIQFNKDAGSAVLYVGNNDLNITASPKMYGVFLFATQAFAESFESNLLLPSQFYLACDTAGQLVSVVATVR